MHRTLYFDLDMAHYIDADKLRAEIERRKGYISVTHFAEELLSFLDTLEEQDMGEVSDGYHTFNELYYYRMLYNAAFFNLLPREWVHKSKRHHTGEECFGGGWFIVVANLPTGQISNHYELKDWGLFQIPEKETADEWDGHTPQEAAERLHKYLTLEEPEVDEELNKAAEEYATDTFPISEETYVDYRVKCAFIAGAKWQYQKDRGEFAKIKAKTWCEGFDAHKEQMMEEAVEGEVVKDINNKLAVTAKNINIDGLKFGEKVKVIVIKEE